MTGRADVYRRSEAARLCDVAANAWARYLSDIQLIFVDCANVSFVSVLTKNAKCKQRCAQTHTRRGENEKNGVG